MVTTLVGLRIAELRRESGMSQLELSSRISMARTYFAEVETGKRNVSMRNLLKIVKGLNVTLAEFFDSPLFEPLYRPDVSLKADPSQTEVRYASVSLPPLDEE